MRKSSVIKKELEEARELAKASGLQEDEAKFIKDKVKKLEKELEEAEAAEEKKPTPKKKAAPKKKEKKTFTIDGQTFDENDPNLCKKLVDQWEKRKKDRKKAGGKRKTKSVIQGIAGNVATTVSKAVKSFSADEIKKNPKLAFRKMERVERLGKKYLDAVKDILGDKLSKKQIDEEFAGLNKVMETIHSKYVAPAQKMARGGIINQYENHTPDQVWEMWDEEQRRHFMSDHKEEIKDLVEGMNRTLEAGKKELSPMPKWSEEAKKSYNDVHGAVKAFLERHVKEGQYEKGGEVEVTDAMREDVAPYLESIYDGAEGIIQEQDGVRFYTFVGYENSSNRKALKEWGLSDAESTLKKLERKGLVDLVYDDETYHITLNDALMPEDFRSKLHYDHSFRKPPHYVEEVEVKHSPMRGNKVKLVAKITLYNGEEFEAKGHLDCIPNTVTLKAPKKYEHVDLKETEKKIRDRSIKIK